MKSEQELDKQQRLAERQVELENLKPMEYEELTAVFHKWMIIPDPGIIKFLLAFYCANELPGPPLWAFIIGPSGGGKTEFLNAFLPMEKIYSISTLTPNTFLSGMPGKGDSSLLPQITGKIALFKDWTSILSMQKDSKAEVMGQFREIYDGSAKKVFGNGRIATWEGKISVLAACTQAVDLNQQQFTHLGERFLNYRIIMPDRKIVAMRSLDNSNNHELMVTELQNAVYAFFKGINFKKSLENIFNMPDEFKSELVRLANFMTMARSGIIRDSGFKKEVIFVPASEMPTRSVGQLAKLASSLYIVNKEKFIEADMEIIYKCALDSIPQTNKMVIAEMARANNQTTSEIATALGYPTEPIRMYLENLAMLKVCKRVRESGNSYRWTMTEEFSDIIRHYEGVTELTDEERKARTAEADGDDDDFVPEEAEGEWAKEFETAK